VEYLRGRQQRGWSGRPAKFPAERSLRLHRDLRDRPGLAFGGSVDEDDELRLSDSLCDLGRELMTRDNFYPLVVSQMMRNLARYMAAKTVIRPQGISITND
jgi:hypothetical protein